MAVHLFAMPSSSALLVFSLVLAVTSARPWPGAAKTSVYHGDQWSPRPTPVPASPRELFKREDVNVAVCGWIGGDSAAPVACGSGSSCVHDTVHGYVGCCATSGPCTAGVYTACADSNSQNSGWADAGITTCASGSYCVQNVYPGGYSQYSCGSSNQAINVETTFSGQPTDLLLQVVYTGVSLGPVAAPSTTSSSTSSATSSSTPSATSSTSIVSSSSSSTAPTSTAGSTPQATSAPAAATTVAVATSHSDVKAIIGGVVGGLAALTAILGVFLYFLQRRHAKRSQILKGSSLGDPSPSSSEIGPTPYSPSNFHNSLPVNQRTPSLIARAFPHNHFSVSPPQPALRQFPQSQVSGSALNDEDEPLVSEIDEFARGFNEIARFHQPGSQNAQNRRSSDARGRDGRGLEDEEPPVYGLETPGFQRPVYVPRNRLPGGDLGPLELIVELRDTSLEQGPEGLGLPVDARGLSRGGSGDSWHSSRSQRSLDSEREREWARLMGEEKAEEDGSPIPATYATPDLGTWNGFGNPTTNPNSSPQRSPNARSNENVRVGSYGGMGNEGGASGNVREEGWTPQQLRTTGSRENDLVAQPNMPRYQLVDEVPRVGIQVLHAPGQLKGTRPVKGRQSP